MPLWHLPFRGHANLRLHRKALVVDGQTALVGNEHRRSTWTVPLAGAGGPGGRASPVRRWRTSRGSSWPIGTSLPGNRSRCKRPRAREATRSWRWWEAPGRAQRSPLRRVPLQRFRRAPPLLDRDAVLRSGRCAHPRAGDRGQARRRRPRARSRAVESLERGPRRGQLSAPGRRVGVRVARFRKGCSTRS